MTIRGSGWRGCKRWDCPTIDHVLVGADIGIARLVYTMVTLSARSCHPNSKSPAAVLVVFGVCFAASLATVSGHALVFTEIHFHPGQTEDPQENLEFVEIYNDDSIVVDLSGHRFSSGLDFTFPNRTFLPARSYLVVCRNVEAVTAHYGIDNAIGDFSGRLDNTGEWIRLVNPMGSTVAETHHRNGGEGTFRADAGAAADGTGLTLAIASFFENTRNTDIWVRSRQLGGNPGAPNFPAPLPNHREILGEGQLWRYKKGGNDASQELAEFSDPPDAWRQFDFDDSAWLEGPTPIGFNEHIIQTVLDDVHRTYISFAVRRELTVRPEAFDAKKHEDSTSIYYGSAALPAEMIRRLARHLGIHVFLETDDVFHVNRHFMMIHTDDREGVREISLPWKVKKVNELFPRKKIAADVDSFKVSLQPLSTYLYYWGD